VGGGALQALFISVAAPEIARLFDLAETFGLISAMMSLIESPGTSMVRLALISIHMFSSLGKPR
jgi:hypothetical protein